MRRNFINIYPIYEESSGIFFFQHPNNPSPFQPGKIPTKKLSNPTTLQPYNFLNVAPIVTKPARIESSRAGLSIGTGFTKIGTTLRNLWTKQCCDKNVQVGTVAPKKPENYIKMYPIPLNLIKYDINVNLYVRANRLDYVSFIPWFIGPCFTCLEICAPLAQYSSPFYKNACQNALYRAVPTGVLHLCGMANSIETGIQKRCSRIFLESMINLRFKF